LKLNELNNEAWSYKGYALYELKRYNESIECYDRSIGNDPQSAIIWNSRGSAHYGLGNYEEALENYNKAMEILQTENQ
jgi:tetratricopeptide (TPR) repeat protein